eukprot:gene9542-biopygen15258
MGTSGIVEPLSCATAAATVASATAANATTTQLPPPLPTPTRSTIAGGNCNRKTATARQGLDCCGPENCDGTASTSARAKLPLSPPEQNSPYLTPATSATPLRSRSFNLIRSAWCLFLRRLEDQLCAQDRFPRTGLIIYVHNLQDRSVRNHVFPFSGARAAPLWGGGCAPRRAAPRRSAPGGACGRRGSVERQGMEHQLATPGENCVQSPGCVPFALS